MTVINAKDYGVIPNNQIGKKLSILFKEISKIEGQKKLIFENGTYFISRKDCDYTYYAITNTVAQSEYKSPENVNMHYVPFNIKNINDLEIDGNDSTFVIDGKVTNLAISQCKNITLENVKLDTVNPNVHKLTVVKQTPFYVEFELDKSTNYVKDGKTFKWCGDGYELGFMQYSNSAFWTSSIKPLCAHKLFRTSHPFMGANSIKEISSYKFKVSYLFHKKFEIGQTFYVFDAMRSDVGLFISESSDISIKNVSQYFNYSLAIVAQDCCNLNFDNLFLAPKHGSNMEVSSLADFIQICMCSGDVNITNCHFDGSADDALNVHGVHFEYQKIDNNKLIAKFSHKQTWGFNPLHIGDKIEFIDKNTLLTVGKNKIISSKLINDYEIELELESSEIPSNAVIEDVCRCPNLLFENNYLDRIITRGLLITTRGKTVVRNNHFVSTTMSGILHSDDAKSWYESGMVKDVTIENNIFEFCGETPILIKPENRVHLGAVHTNITISNNKFYDYKNEPISIKSSNNINISNNLFLKSNKIKEKNCDNIILKGIQK